MTTQGDLRALMEAEYKAGERATSGAMRGVASEVKADWRGQVQRVGLGRRLSNAIRGEAYPKGDVSMGAAALIWTRAPKIIGAFEKGAVIRSASGSWLAIPTDAAGKGRYGRRMTPAAWEQRHGIRLRFVYRRGRTALLVADDARLTKRGQARQKRGRRRRKDGILTGAQTVVVFVLVPQARLAKRLDLLQSAERIGSELSSRIVAGWRSDNG